MDYLVLLYHLRKGAQDDQIGFEDANETLLSLSARLNKKLLISQNDLESCLWSCNLMNEQDKWWSPRDEAFDEFVKRVAPEGFNRIYNLIEKKERK